MNVFFQVYKNVHCFIPIEENEIKGTSYLNCSLNEVTVTLLAAEKIMSIIFLNVTCFDRQDLLNHKVSINKHAK